MNTTRIAVIVNTEAEAREWAWLHLIATQSVQFDVLNATTAARRMQGARYDAVLDMTRYPQRMDRETRYAAGAAVAKGPAKAPVKKREPVTITIAGQTVTVE